MDSENKQHEENRDWRDIRREWREEKRRWKDERRKMWHDHKGDFQGYMAAYKSGPVSNKGRIWTGVFILVVGVAALMKVALVPLPQWLFTWQMLLIALGLFMGIGHNFRGGAWFILMLIGGIFLVDEYFTNVTMRQYLWPVGLIVVGLFFIFKPRRRNWGADKKEPVTNENIAGDKNFGASRDTNSTEDVVDSTSIFGGIKKNVYSKDFKGGDIVNIMGGSELDLTQADINGTVRLELTQIFGGTKLVVPSNWQIKTEMAAIFGGVEDKRAVRDTAQDPNKVLILSGTSIFGGIDIRSY